MDQLANPLLIENARAGAGASPGIQELILRCWRRETDLDENEWPARNAHKLIFNGQLSGDLPALNARLEHVTLMELTGDKRHVRVGEFLQAFPNLTALTVEQHALQRIPRPGVRTQAIAPAQAQQ